MGLGVGVGKIGVRVGRRVAAKSTGAGVGVEAVAGSERQRTKKTRVLIPAAHRVTVGASVLLIATVTGIGWWFWSLRQASLRVDAEISRAETETVQLRGVLAQVQKFETRKAQLQQRVSLIEQLRKGQSAPVHVLDNISRGRVDCQHNRLGLR